jgi:hypothetical protein
VVSYLVDTDTEKAIKRTKGLVQAVNQRDWTAFRSLIDPQTVVFAFKGPDAITTAARAAAERNNVGNLRIIGTDVQQAQTVINVNIRVLSEQLGTSAVTDWQLQFQDFGRGWELFRVQLLPGTRARQATRFLRDGLRAS